MLAEGCEKAGEARQCAIHKFSIISRGNSISRKMSFPFLRQK
ncbi:hypothetical protein CIT292_09574 [Citrobacter youngae ATCC 29220]|uniref:Uncharacterized protein n=1 Tax=Citrobacter youngae ATCC 29220 TaxID=500640 RepID=D4BGC7_9ENTR|nr:hypothetical protein CIT292_09574 [Citrobacter youngae ATCC 29220]